MRSPNDDDKFRPCGNSSSSSPVSNILKHLLKKLMNWYLRLTRGLIRRKFLEVARAIFANSCKVLPFPNRKIGPNPTFSSYSDSDDFLNRGPIWVPIPPAGMGWWTSTATRLLPRSSALSSRSRRLLTRSRSPTPYGLLALQTLASLWRLRDHLDFVISLY